MELINDLTGKSWVNGDEGKNGDYLGYVQIHLFTDGCEAHLDFCYPDDPFGAVIRDPEKLTILEIAARKIMRPDA